jgi:hypothetical protein
MILKNNVLYLKARMKESAYLLGSSFFMYLNVH